jgi:hypothetical protein
VANQIDPAMQEYAANIATLERRLPARLLASVEWGGSSAIEWTGDAACWAQLLDGA